MGNFSNIIQFLSPQLLTVSSSARVFMDRVSKLQIEWSIIISRSNAKYSRRGERTSSAREIRRFYFFFNFFLRRHKMTCTGESYRSDRPVICA